MAQGVGLGKFYVALGALAVIGGGAIWMSRDGGGASSGPAPALPAGAAAAFAGYQLGSDSAPLEIIEYADFQCPACARFAIVTFPDVHERLIKTGRVRWRFRDFPLPVHDKSKLAHHAAACAAEQDAFWAMHDQLYYNQPDWSQGRGVDRKFREYARAVGADVNRFEDCMRSNRYAGRIEASLEQATEAGISSTPSLIIGDILVSGTLPYDSLKVLVDRVAPAGAE